MMMMAICSSKTSVLIRTTWHNIPEDGILHISVNTSYHKQIIICSIPEKEIIARSYMEENQ
jgi:hypothetical protein